MPKSISPEAAVSLIERLTGAKPGYRRAHARGLILQGIFQPAPEARSLSIAEHLQGAPIPCLVRFSNASANPCSPDRQSATVGRVVGLAIRFTLPSGAYATWGAINIRAFPARTPDEFLALSSAQASGKGGKPNMLRLLWHVVRHLHILASIKSIKGLKPSGSFAMETYRGLHTYYFIDAKGARKPFRYQWVPRLAPVPLSPEEAEARPGQYLLEEIRARLKLGALSWDLVAQFPEPGDALDDPSVAWPDERSKALLGRLILDGVHPDQRAVENLVFDPTGVVPGIALSEDPILKYRSLAYGVSFERRSKETRVEPAPADMGQ